MPNLQDLRRRVRAVKNMRQITRAMKMVASARLRRAQQRAIAARPFAIKVNEILADITRRAPNYSHPLLAAEPGPEEAPSGPTLVVLVTGDKGLCGAFNTNVNKAGLDFLRSHAGEQVEMVIVGRKGYDFFRRRRANIRRHYLGVTGGGKANFNDAVEIAQQCIADFTAEEHPVSKVFLIYTEFKSAISQRVAVDQLLPIGKGAISDQALSSDGNDGNGGHEPVVEYLYEQQPDELFGSLLPKAIEVQIYRALLDSVASELGSRMTAMDSASKNADDVISKLTLNMNRVRQAAITREIIEVVSGAEALS
jgi:F-type H+-transporting ATPase subunit gamma